MTKILVGSRAFFSGIEGFKSKDTDFLVLVDNPTDFQWRREQSLRGVCTFYYKKETPTQMIQRTLEADDPLLIGKFLVPEVAKAIGATVDDILPLEPLLDKLDDKHKYEALIFNAYKANGKFSLTAKQCKQAFNAYQQARKENEPKRERRQPILAGHKTASANLG